MSKSSVAPLTKTSSIVIISDRVVRHETSRANFVNRWSSLRLKDRPWRGVGTQTTMVTGSYLERLPLACIAAGIVDQAEIWHHQWNGDPEPFHATHPSLGYRAFLLDKPAPPFTSSDMLAFVRAFGAPHVLVVYGLGVSATLLAACANSVIIYNSIDAPTFRVPTEVSAHFDLVLTGAQWQSDEVEARHPGMPTAIMPVGPEFAAIDLFRPLGTPKDYDLIYVAAAQPYKRHDILFDAFATLPSYIRGLCVFGYGDDAGVLRDQIAKRGLSIDCIGPPGVALEDVNRLMNRARFGVVCGQHDGAPAILTEYMLAGLPVLANAALVCGRQFILPQTGMLATADKFADGILAMRDTGGLTPRDAVLARWTWPHTIERLRPLLRDLALKKIASQ